MVAAGGAGADVRSAGRAAQFGRPSAAVPGPPDRRQRPVLPATGQAPSGGSAGLRVAGGRCRTRHDAAAHDQRLAASYIAAIRESTAGPYNIGGWSFGGYVAVEMARQLADEELARLILLDTFALDDGPRAVIAENKVISWFFAELMWQAHGAPKRETLPSLGHNGADRDALFDSILRQAVEAGIVPAEGSPQLIRRLYGIFHANYEATLNYRHEPLDRDITLLKSTEQLPAVAAHVHRVVGTSFASPTNGWERLMPRSLTVVDVPGDHLSMMSGANVADVAAKLEAALQMSTPKVLIVGAGIGGLPRLSRCVPRASTPKSMKPRRRSDPPGRGLALPATRSGYCAHWVSI